MITLWIVCAVINLLSIGYEWGAGNFKGKENGIPATIMTAIIIAPILTILIIGEKIGEKCKSRRDKDDK